MNLDKALAKLAVQLIEEGYAVWRDKNGLWIQDSDPVYGICRIVVKSIVQHQTARYVAGIKRRFATAKEMRRKELENEANKIKEAKNPVGTDSTSNASSPTEPSTGNGQESNTEVCGSDQGSTGNQTPNPAGEGTSPAGIISEDNLLLPEIPSSEGQSCGRGR